MTNHMTTKQTTQPTELSDFLTFDQLARLLPARADGSRVDKAALWRWARQGQRAGNTIVFLAYMRLGRRMFTTLRNVRRFSEEVAACEQRRDATAAQAPPASRERPRLRSRV